MSEQLRQESLGAGPVPFGDGFATATVESPGSVEVIHGVYAHTLPLAGLTVKVARAELEDRMNIDPEAVAVVDGNAVAEDAVLRQGQVLNFVKAAGEKG